MNDRENYKFNSFSQILRDEMINSNSIENILLARGFLVETMEYQGKNTLFLSDNAYFDGNVNQDSRLRKSDAVFLRELCGNCNSLNVVIYENGCSAARIEWSGYIDDEFINSLFKGRPIQMEAGLNYVIKHKRFLKHDHALKVPLSYLEPGIAILIKALSAIGIGTWSACDGHGVGEARIDFEGMIPMKWCEKIISEINKMMILKNKWVFAQSNLIIKDSSGLYDIDFFREIINVGMEIYNSRKRFLATKMQFLELVTSKDSEDHMTEIISRLEF